MVDVDLNKIRILAESAERRAEELHGQYVASVANSISLSDSRPASLLNDFFYWSGKATSYRGIVAMAEMREIVERELEEEGSCP